MGVIMSPTHGRSPIALVCEHISAAVDSRASHFAKKCTPLEKDFYALEDNLHDRLWAFTGARKGRT